MRGDYRRDVGSSPGLFFDAWDNFSPRHGSQPSASHWQNNLYGTRGNADRQGRRSA